MEWNSKEKKELIKLYPKYTAKELEVKFKRSSKAIHRMANLLGIYKTANKVPPNLYDVGLRFMIVHCRVRADNKKNAKYRAIEKVERSILKRQSIKNYVFFSKSTVEMSENIDKKLQQIIDLEIRELYDLAFFKPYLVNYIADFKPQFPQSMSNREYRDYLDRKNEEAIQEFCRSIKADCPRNEAITNALHVLLSDLL